MKDLVVASNNREGFGLNYRIDHLETRYLSGWVGSGPFDSGHIWSRQVWSRLIEFLGDDAGPYVTANHARETEFTMYAGHLHAIQPGETAMDQVVILIPRHEYAVAHVQGSQQDVYDTYRHLHAWVGDRGHEVNSGALTLEMYLRPPLDDGTALDFEIWLPLL